MVFERVELPDGGWANLRDPQLVSERQRRPVKALQARVTGSEVGALFKLKDKLNDEEFEERTRLVLGKEDWDLLDDLNDALIGALVESWSYDQPVSVDAALELPGPVYEALKAACAKHVNALLPTFAATKETVGDPDSPTEPSLD